MSAEQWLENGDCSKCRRKNYCGKRCKKSRQAVNMKIRSMIAEAMANVSSKETSEDNNE